MNREYLRSKGKGHVLGSVTATATATATVEDYTQSTFPYKGISLDGRVVTRPYPYQLETIEWMMARENEPPAEGISGGFVFSDMGTGKTMCALTCCVLHGGKTLIICPALLTGVWMNEVYRHFKKVDPFLYYGPNRKAAYHELISDGGSGLPDIIVTAYTTLVSDIDDEEGPFQNVQFHRLILDETHYVRNNKTKAFLAVERVSASVKWLLSGTPLPNSVTEMYPYLKLLGYSYVKNVDVLSKKAFNNRFISRTGYINMQNILKRVAIRKTKEVLALPDRQVRDVSVIMSTEERAFYDALKSYSKLRLKKLLRNLRRVSYSGLGRQLQARLRMINLQSVLSLIFHLRLACCDPQLVLKKIPRLRGAKLRDAAVLLGKGEDDDNDCPVCHNEGVSMFLSTCGHKACRGCWEKLSAMEPLPICFECMSPMSTKNLRTIPGYNTPVEADGDGDGDDKADEESESFRSCKTKAIMKRISHELDRGEKIIVVSQWTTYLAVLIKEFTRKHPDMPYAILTGAVPPVKRQSIIARFQNEDQDRVLFASLGSSAEGITLTAACRMIISEPFWNQARIDQMSDRMHRLGQNREVRVYCMFLERSIETKILELVEKKSQNVSVILECKPVNASTEAWLSKVVKLLDD